MGSGEQAGIWRRCVTTPWLGPAGVLVAVGASMMLIKGVLVVQLPIFILAGAIGDTVGSEETTDGLGLALTGAAWMILGFSLTLDSSSR